MKIYKVIILSIFYLFINNQILAQEDTTNLSESFEELLNLSLKELMEVDITTAAKKAQKISDAPSIISAVTKQDIEKMGVTSLIDVLKYIPGIETSMGANGHYRVSIRGERKDGNILVLINGQQINDFYDGKSIFDFPVDFIEKIEIIRGPGSAIYGTNAIIGVINIISRKGNNGVNMHTGTNGSYSSSLYYHHGIDSSGLSIIGGFSQTNGANVSPYSFPLDTIYNDKTNRWLKDAYLQTSVTNKNLNISLFGIWRNQGSWIGPLYELCPDSEYKTGQIIGNISYNIQLNKKLSITPKIYTDYIYHDYYLQEHTDGYIKGTSIFIDGAITKEKYKGITLGSEILVNYDVNDNLGIISGLVYENLSFLDYSILRNYKIIGDEYIGYFGNHDNVSMDQKDKTRDIIALYFSGDYNWEKVILTLGFRYDYYSDFGTSFNPRLGFMYKPNKHLSFKLLYGQAFRAPTFKELYDKTNFDETGVLGNDTLKPETIKSTELGIEYKNPNFVTRINAFYNHSNNIISIYDPHGSGETGTFQNIGNSNNWGFEFETVIEINRKFNFFVNLSRFNKVFEWSSNELFMLEANYLIKNGDGTIKNIPNFRINGGFDFTSKKLHTFIGVNYGNESMNNNRFFLDKRFVEIDPYIHANFYIAYNFSQKAKISLAGNNIGKIKYSDPEESTNINLLGRKGMGQPGSTYILSLTYKL